MAQVVFFDVANTLLYKPDLVPTISSVLRNRGVSINEGTIRAKHKLLSEVIAFPDKTSKNFYAEFNRELLLLLGVEPHVELVDDLYQSCSYLPWKPFEDLEILKNIGLPLGILSNWDESLTAKLSNLIAVQFEWIFASGVEGLRKPSRAFFMNILESTGLSPADVLYVGDSVKLDIIPALQLKMNAVLIDRENDYEGSSLKRMRNMSEIKNYL